MHIIQQSKLKHILQNQWTSFFPAIAFAVACYVGYMFSNPLYNSSDNVDVAMVVNGYYGSSNFCQYIHPLLCLFIRCLTPFFPTADVFTLLIHIVIALQIGTLFHLFTDDIQIVKGRDLGLAQGRHLAISGLFSICKFVVTVMAILLFTAGIVIWNTNYTITTGAIILFGIIILFCAERENRNISWIIIGTATTCFGCMLRMESALLFFPFVVLEVAAHYLSARGKLISGAEIVAGSGVVGKTAVGEGAEDPSKGEADDNFRMKHLQPEKTLLIRSRLLPCAVVIFILFVSRAGFYSQEPYRTASRFNAARTTCVDFPMAPWSSKVEAAANGAFSSIDYAVATDWCFIDTGFLNADMMERIAAAGKKNRYEISESGIKGMRNEMKRTLFHSSLYMVILIVLSAVLAVRNVICCDVWRKAETILAILGGFIILAYFTIRGRAPMRVWEPVIFAADFDLLMAAMDKAAVSRRIPSKQLTNLNHFFAILMFIVLWFSTGQLIAYASCHKPQPVWLSGIPAEHSEYGTTVSEAAGIDALFIWPNWHAHFTQETYETGRLPSREVMQHNIAIGDWVYGQPYFTEFLRSINAENPAAALLNRPNTYIMGGKDGLVNDYLQEHLADLTESTLKNTSKNMVDNGASVCADSKTVDERKTVIFEPVRELGLIEGGYAYRVKVINEEEH